MSLGMSCRKTGPGARVRSGSHVDDGEGFPQRGGVRFIAGAKAGDCAADAVWDPEHGFPSTDPMVESGGGRCPVLAPEGVEHVDVASVVGWAPGFQDQLVDAARFEFGDQALQTFSSGALGAPFGGDSLANDDDVFYAGVGDGFDDGLPPAGAFVAPVDLALGHAKRRHHRADRVLFDGGHDSGRENVGPGVSGMVRAGFVDLGSEGEWCRHVRSPCGEMSDGTVMLRPATSVSAVPVADA